MAHAITPKFRNDIGVDIIDIGVKEFECIGAAAPFDHPHIYLDMGSDSEIICPYCSTVYRHKATLGPEDSLPENSFYKEQIEG